MARRKSHRRHHPRRRMSGVGSKGVLMKVAGIGAGIFAGRMLTTKLAATMNPKISGAVAIALGIFAPRFLKSDLGEGLGSGLIAAGLLAELQSFNVISGMGALPPGQAASLSTNNNYDARVARAVGDSGRPIMKSTVGYLNGMENLGISSNELNAIGALIEE